MISNLLEIVVSRTANMPMNVLARDPLAAVLFIIELIIVIFRFFRLFCIFLFLLLGLLILLIVILTLITLLAFTFNQTFLGLLVLLLQFLELALRHLGHCLWSERLNSVLGAARLLCRLEAIIYLCNLLQLCFITPISSGDLEAVVLFRHGFVLLSVLVT